MEMTAERSAKVASAIVVQTATGRLTAATPYAMVIFTETESVNPTR
jgi:hypothetical protein